MFCTLIGSKSKKQLLYSAFSTNKDNVCCHDKWSILFKPVSSSFTFNFLAVKYNSELKIKSYWLKPILRENEIYIPEKCSNLKFFT